jgi:hypothetical protein
MAGSQPKLDSAGSKQMDLFDITAGNEAIFQPRREPKPGSLGIGPSVKELLSTALKGVAYKRWEIAGRMSEYVGAEITESMLNSWTAESKEQHRFPLEYLPAFCWATGCYDLADMVVRACGCCMIRSEEVALLELARIGDAKRQLAQREKRMQSYLQLMRRDGAKP